LTFGFESLSAKFDGDQIRELYAQNLVMICIVYTYLHI
jgi:hypothetical protein